VIEWNPAQPILAGITLLAVAGFCRVGMGLFTFPQFPQNVPRYPQFLVFPRNLRLTLQSSQDVRKYLKFKASQSHGNGFAVRLLSGMFRVRVPTGVLNRSPIGPSL